MNCAADRSILGVNFVNDNQTVPNRGGLKRRSSYSLLALMKLLVLVLDMRPLLTEHFESIDYGASCILTEAVSIPIPESTAENRLSS